MAGVSRDDQTAQPLRFSPLRRPAEQGALPRCLNCGYDLFRLTVSRCPECGRAFDPGDPATFTRLPPYVRWLYWLPGALLAVVLGAGVAAYFISQNRIGWGLSLGVPLGVGSFLGYGCKTSTVIGYGVLAMVVVFVAGGVVSLLMGVNVVGVLCGMILAAIFMIPVLIGVAIGSVLRAGLRDSGFSQRWYLPAALIVLLPLAADAAERALDLPRPPESLTSVHHLALPPARAFHLKPAPDSAVLPEAQSLPSGLQVGEAATLPAGHGTLTIRVTDRREGEWFAFDYANQADVEDRAVRLLSSSFAFAPDGEGTDVKVTTRYEPLMTPRWLWRPFERRVGAAVHAATLGEGD